MPREWMKLPGENTQGIEAEEESIMGQSLRHTHTASWGRGRGAWKNSQRKGQREKRKTMAGGRRETEP